MFTKRNASLAKELKQLQSAEADLLRQQGAGDQKKQSTARIIPTTQHILESYFLLIPSKKEPAMEIGDEESCTIPFSGR